MPTDAPKPDESLGELNRELNEIYRALEMVAENYRDLRRHVAGTLHGKHEGGTPSAGAAAQESLHLSALVYRLREVAKDLHARHDEINALIQ